MTVEEPSGELRVLAKLAPARFNQAWHYHLANAAGRPRCGALLNLREWQIRELPHAPGGLCARCARLLRPRTAAPAPRSLRVAGGNEAPDQAQLALPLAEEAEPTEEQPQIERQQR